MITIRRVVLLCALISVALTASVLAPEVSPSIGEINSHSVQVNLQNGGGQGIPQVGQKANITLYEGGNTTIVCGMVAVSIPRMLINGTLVFAVNSTIALVIWDGNATCYSASP